MLRNKNAPHDRSEAATGWGCLSYVKEKSNYGHLNNTNYLRWMQEAAFAASSAVGYDFARYDEIGHLWLVRESDIEYLAPLAHGDEVQVKTWVMDFRRFLSRRAYEFTLTRTAQLVARASTDWAYVSAESLRPAAIPEAIRQAFFPEGAPQEAARRDRFPAPPPPPVGVFSIRKRVEWRDIDSLWHVNNAMYLAYIENAAIQVSEAHGWPMQRMKEEGFGILARRHRIEYRQPAQIGDELEVSTWFSDAQRSTAFRHYGICRVSDGELLVRARSLYVWVDLKTGRPIRIPHLDIWGSPGGGLNSDCYLPGSPIHQNEVRIGWRNSHRV